MMLKRYVMVASAVFLLASATYVFGQTVTAPATPEDSFTTVLKNFNPLNLGVFGLFAALHVWTMKSWIPNILEKHSKELDAARKEFLSTFEKATTDHKEAVNRVTASFGEHMDKQRERQERERENYREDLRAALARREAR